MRCISRFGTRLVSCPIRYQEPFIRQIARRLWFEHFKKPFSTIPAYPTSILDALEKHFFNCRWHEVYDFVEAILALNLANDVGATVNSVLERELAPYRLVKGQFVAITDEHELADLEQSLTLGAGDKFSPVSAHFKRALELLSDRANPDFRNSIKESVCAVEAAARVLTGRDDATLGEALKVLERDHELHKALKEGFSKLYGYTSDANGIRHAMLEEPSLGIAEAKFFLLSCSSFVNYLKSRSA